jgi:LPS-assembly lipoprotein
MSEARKQDGGVDGGPTPRRALLRGVAGLLALGAGGCGFRPLHGGGAAMAGGDPAIASDMAATRVALIPERFGQLLRRGLEQRLGAANGGRAVPARWELVVGPSLAAEGIGIMQDGAATRVRYIATANWTLLRLNPRESVANGFERAIDAYNIQPNQYFAADVSREATERRLAEQLAEEMAMRVALRFRGLRNGEPGQLIEPVQTMQPMTDPALPAGRGGPAVPVPSGAMPGGLGGGIGPGGAVR